MRFKQNGNKRDLMAAVIYNDEASATIPLGAPVVLSLSGTQDGLGVVLPSTATDAKQSSLAFGVSLGSYAPKAFGEAQLFGLNNNVLLLRTRGASTDAFASVNSGALLKANSVSNAFETVASNGASAFIPAAIVASSIASIASTAASTATGATQLCSAMIRMM